MSGAARAAPRPFGLGRGRKRTASASAQPLERSLLQTATLCLLALGVVMVFSASSTTSLLGETGDSAFYLKRTLLYGAIGLLVMRILSVHGLEFVRLATPVILGVSIVLLFAVLLPGFGIEGGGARRWIDAGPFQVQPSELAKLALVLYGAQLLAKRPRMVAGIREMAPFLLITGLVCALILVEPDLGTALVAGLAVAGLLVAAGAQLRHLALVAGVIAFFALIAIMIEPYRQDRLAGFLDPGSEASGAGFQGIQATLALGSGGIFGVGLGESVQKAFFLPEAHTDMIAAVIGEELGLLGIAVLVGLLGMFGYAGFRIAQRAGDRYGKLLAAGLTGMIMVQAALNLFAVLGLAPLTGVPLPLVSYGNSSLIVTLAAVGLILNVASGGTGGGSPKLASAPAAEAAPGRRSGSPRRRKRRRSGARLRSVEGGRRGATGSSRRAKEDRGEGGNRRRRHGRPRRSGARRRRRASR